MRTILVGSRCSIKTCGWVYGYRPSKPKDFPFGRFRPAEVVRYCPRCAGASVAIQWPLMTDLPVFSVSSWKKEVA